jgi:putative addiction module killer protein
MLHDRNPPNRELREVVSRPSRQPCGTRIDARIRRLELGNPGDVKSVGEGVSEMRIDYGPGYRVYFAKHGERIVILLCGGDKSRQSADIAEAKRLLREL